MPLLDRQSLPAVIVAFMLFYPVTHSAPAAAPDRDAGSRAIQQALRASVMIEADGIYGAGILIDPARGLVVTNYHVVSDMKIPRVTSYAGRSGDAQVLATDAKRDLALLSAPALRDAETLPPKLVDAATLVPGEEVFAIGMPRKLAFTVSRGIVSYVGRPLEGEHYLQVDMNINEGNSGGPVMTKSGEIAGVMSFIYRRANGLAFALPIVEAQAAFPEKLPSQMASAQK